MSARSRSFAVFAAKAPSKEYQTLPSVRTIAFVDPANEMCRTRERLSANAWSDQMFSGNRGIPIPALDLVIPHDEIFARD